MYFVLFVPIVPFPVNVVRPPDDVSVFVIVTLPDDVDALVFPAASLKDPAATVTVPVPPTVPDGVYVTVYAVLLELARFESVPPVALKSASAKLDEASLSVMDTETVDPALTLVAVTEAVGAVESRVTVFVDADDKLPAASTAYTLYEPSERPVPTIDVFVFAAVTDAEFHDASAAPVMLASLDTVTDDNTKYTVPVSVLWAVADDALRIVAVVADAVGAEVSIVIVLAEDVTEVLPRVDRAVTD